jgi:hypothetical protein
LNNIFVGKGKKDEKKLGKASTLTKMFERTNAVNENRKRQLNDLEHEEQKYSKR